MIELPNELATALADVKPKAPAEKILHATRLAMAFCDTALDGTDDARCGMWEAAFRALYKARPSYQYQDFEIVDYQLTTVPGIPQLIRGPAPNAAAIEAGEFICVLGAAQLFGRFSNRSFAEDLEREFGLPVLNLSKGGAGPGIFLDPAYRQYIEKAKLVIVQVLSGRSVGCETYPGDMMTMFEGVRMSREFVLAKILKRSREEYRETVKRWNENYVKLYHSLAQSIQGKSVLLWISQRGSDQWSVEQGEETGSFGAFPQLIGAGTHDRIQPAFDGFASVIHAKGLVRFTSRISGEAAPFITSEGQPRWQSDYYPPPSVQESIAATLAAEIKARDLLYPVPVPVPVG